MDPGESAAAAALSVCCTVRRLVCVPLRLLLPVADAAAFAAAAFVLLQPLVLRAAVWVLFKLAVSTGVCLTVKRAWAFEGPGTKERLRQRS